MPLNKFWLLAATALLAVSCDKPPAPTAAPQQSATPAAAKVADAKPTEGSALERAMSKRGSVGVRGFSKAGTVKGTLYSQVDIDVRELYDGEKPNDRIYGLLFNVGDGQGLSRAFVDYDEIDALLAGMDYAAKANPALVHFKKYQVDYVTRGGLKMSTFNDDKDALNAVVEASGRSAFLTMPQFAQVRELIVKSKTMLDETRKPVSQPTK